MPHGKIKITEKKKMRCDLDTAQMLLDIFGPKIMKDIEITVNGGEKEKDGMD